MSKIFAEQLLFKPHGLGAWTLLLLIKINLKHSFTLVFQIIFCNNYTYSFYFKESVTCLCLKIFQTMLFRHHNKQKKSYTCTSFLIVCLIPLNFIETIAKHKMNKRRRCVCKTQVLYVLTWYCVIIYTLLMAI